MQDRQQKEGGGGQRKEWMGGGGVSEIKGPWLVIQGIWGVEQHHVSNACSSKDSALNKDQQNPWWEQRASAKALPSPLPH